MRITFNERFALPVEDVFSYFASPADWSRLYGFSGVRELGSGWYAVGIKGFPFPLIAKTTLVEANNLVRWTFRGFWRGEGEIKFTSSPGSVLVEGYEEIAVRWLFFLSPLVERTLLESRFRAIWQLGWRRLRKHEHSSHSEALPATQGDPPPPLVAGDATRASHGDRHRDLAHQLTEGKRVFTKATNRERGNPQRSQNWLMSRRGWFKIFPDRIECGNWLIPSTAVEKAILYRGRQFLLPVSVLEVATADTTYQFGFNPWVDVEPDLPFPVESRRVSIGYSPFSLAIRVLLLIFLVWYAWQRL